MRSHIIFLLLGLLILISCIERDLENRSTSTVTRDLKQYVQNELKGARFSGTLVIGSSDTIVYSDAIGIADRVWDIPMQTNHRFDIASVNKSFIAVLILLAHEEGKLSLDSKLTEILSGYSYPGTFHSDITVHQMLSHTSGLPDYDAVEPELSANEFLKFKRMHFSNSEYVNFISRLEPVANPGEEFYYSNFAYHLLAIILEEVYESDFNSLLQQKICQPLNLTDTFADSSRRKVHKKVVEGYTYSNGKWLRNHYIDLSLGRRIFSTTSDLYRWARAMDDTSFLSKESQQLMKTNHLSEISNRFSYGYGWVVFEEKSNYEMGQLPTDKPYIIHGGSTEGYKSILVNINRGEWIIALLSNTGNQTDEMQIAQNITTILMNSEHEN